MPSSLIRLLFGVFVATSVPCWCGTRWIFEPNVGQTATAVRYLGRAGSALAYVTPSEVVLAPGGGEDVLRLRFLGARSSPAVEAADPLPGKSNYLTAKVRRTGIPQFGRAGYRDLYPGIDLVLYGGEDGLEYDFEIAPGANPRAIRLSFEGAKKLTLDKRGDLLITTEGGELRQRRPHVYQESGGNRTTVPCEYVLVDSDEVRLKLGPYDQEKSLVVDPVLAFSTQLGRSEDFGSAMTLDSEGNLYVVGSALSRDFPTTPGAYSRIRQGGDDCSISHLVRFCTDVFVAKFNPQGDLLYSTFIGGTQPDSGAGIAVDAAGNAYVTGSTASSDFPVTERAFQTGFRGGYCVYDPGPGPPISYACSDGFVLKLNPAGSAIGYATYLAGNGSEYGKGIAVDSSGNVTVVGNTDSADFPVLPQAPTVKGIFLAKLNSTGGALLYSRILGGASTYGTAADNSGALYIAAVTRAADFPYTPGAFVGPSCGKYVSCDDLVVAKHDDKGDVVYAARLGSVLSSFSIGIAVDSEGSAYVTGTTESDDFPVTASPPRFRSFPGWDIFLSKLDPQGSALVYSLRIGGRAQEYGGDVALDREGNAYVVGQSDSVDFPSTPGAMQPCGGGGSGGSGPAVLFRIDASGTNLLYSTRLDQYEPRLRLAVDTDGNPWLTGRGAFLTKVDFSQDMGRQVTCVAGAASLRSGPVSPGELVAIFGAELGPETPAWLTLNSEGRVSTELAGVRVLFDGVPAPLIYVQANQINAVVPFGVSGRTTTQMEVEYQGQKTDAVAIPVAEATPGVFTLDMSGGGQGAILNEDGTVNGPDNPAPEGSTIAMWATGGGLTDRGMADGEVVESPYPLPRLPVRVQVNVMDQEVTYAGVAPGMVAGVLQVNVRIAPGTKRPWGVLSFAVGDKWSPSIELAIK